MILVGSIYFLYACDVMYVVIRMMYVCMYIIDEDNLSHLLPRLPDNPTLLTQEIRSNIICNSKKQYKLIISLERIRRPRC